MEVSPFVVWFGTIAAVLALGLGSMLRAYQGSGSATVLFPEAIALSDQTLSGLSAETIAAFRQGLAAFEQESYRQAARQWAIAAQLAPDCPEIQHNWGLALANFCEEREAAACLAQAGQQYVQRGDATRSALVRRHLTAMADRLESRRALG